MAETTPAPPVFACGDKLAVDAYLKSLIEPLPTTLGTPSHGPLSGGGGDEPFAAAAPILARLLDAEEALLERRESIARRAARLASAVRDEERAFLRDAPALDTATREMHAALDDLDARVSHVAASSSGIGESLRLAAAHRAATERARLTALHLAMFNARRHDGLLDDDDDSLDVDLDDSDDDFNDAGGGGGGGASPFGLGLDGDEDVVAAVFTDPKRNAEAAKLAQSLLELARQHERSRHDRAGEPKPSLRVAVENLERYCDELENRLLEKFERYEAKRDVVGMRQCAKTVSHFNGGASLVQRFVATRPMFLKVEALERLDALRDFAPAYGSGLSEEKEASDAAEAALEVLDVFFQETLAEATKEVETARAVFPATCDAVGQLVRRVVEQRIGAAVDAIAGPRPPPPPVPGPPAASEGSYFASFMSPRKAPATTTARKHRRNVSFGGDLRGFDPAQAQPAQAPMTDFPASRLGHSRSFGMLEGRPGSGEKGEKETNDDEEEEDTVAPLGEPAQPASPAAKTARPKTAGHSRSKSYTEYMTPSFMSSKANGGFYGDPARDEFENSHGVGRDAIVEGTPPGAGHFALLAYLKILAGAVDRARALGAALAHVAANAGRRRVDAVNACDALFSERREGYGNLEGDCLVGLAASGAAASPGAAPDESGVHESGVPGFDRLIRWHREASERCATVLAPPFRDVTALNGSADDDDGDFDGIADAPGERSSSSSSSTAAAAAGGSRVRSVGTSSRVASAVASASALRESVDTELRLAETFVGETERLCRLALDAAVDACERRSGRFDARSDPREVATTGIGCVLRAAADALDAVERARDANARLCDAIEARTRDASAEIESDVDAFIQKRSSSSSGDETVVEDLTGSLRMARRAAEACRVAVDGRHAECVRDVSDAVVQTLRKGLKSLMFVVEKTLTGLQRRADFKPNEEEMETWTQFPGQEPTPACAAALALVREAYNVAAECLAPDESVVESSVQSASANEGFEHPNIRTFAEECASMLHKTVLAHVARFHHTATGALQLKRDVGELDAFVGSICASGRKSSPASRAWRDALDRCNALIIPAHALPELLRETRAAAVADAEAERARRGIEEAGGLGENDGDAASGGDDEERRARVAKEAGDNAVEEMVRIIHLRADFHPSMLKVLSPKKG